MSEFVAVDAPAATEFDRAMMRRCLELARQALGRTAPNPMVGSVIVQGTEVVGEGFHPGAGQPHAEVFALRAAGDRARGATAYVSLEPCNHYGRTPPCSKALVEAGVAKVVIGTVDPNPQVAGQGIATLNAAGIETLVGVERAACDRLNEPFFYHIQHGRPLGILKYAMTLDGKIATTHGHSAWVTDEQARAEVHRLRAGCDAVIVGGNTVRRDNPKLTSHGLESHNPLRVVMTRRLELPQTTADGRILYLWEPSEAPTLVLTLPGANPEMWAWLTDRGVEVQEVPDLSPAQAIEVLNQRQFLSVLWECGGALSAQAIADGSVQKILAFIAPKIVGGAAAPSPVGDLGLTQMGDAIALERVTWRSVGQDFAIEGYLRPITRTH